MQNYKFEIPIDYLLANRPFSFQGIGTMQSPKLKDLYDSTSENLQTYTFAKTLVNGRIESVATILSQLSGDTTLLNTKDKSKFDLISQIPIGREIFAKVLSLFFINRIGFEESEQAFILLKFDEDKEAQSDILEGFVTKDKFDLYCDIMRQLMHDSLKEVQSQEDYSNKPPEVIKALETFHKYENQEKSKNFKDYTLSNIISKMCTGNSGYNLLNIYDLSVWQLYDQFQSYAQNRISRISERSFSIWGGDKFDFDLWLKNNN